MWTGGRGKDDDMVRLWSRKHRRIAIRGQDVGQGARSKDEDRK